jgi:glutamyl/glutaminyl-tRNA synthetase
VPPRHPTTPPLHHFTTRPPEFADHRPLYDWILDELAPSNLITAHPQQIEFSRLNLQYTVLSKRKLIQLVTDKHVNGWDDPRMPTVSGLRRRGYPASAIRLFCERVGISKAENNIDMTVLEVPPRHDEARQTTATINSAITATTLRSPPLRPRNHLIDQKCVPPLPSRHRC